MFTIRAPRRVSCSNLFNVDGNKFQLIPGGSANSSIRKVDRMCSVTVGPVVLNCVTRILGERQQDVSARREVSAVEKLLILRG